MWYPDVNSIKPYFSMLSSTFHLHDLHAVLNLVQVPTQKSQGMQVVRTFCSLNFIRLLRVVIIPSVIERRKRLEAIGWISGYTFCSSTAKTSTVTFIFYFMILMTTIVPFNKKKYWQNPCSVFWPFHDLPWPAEKELVSHTVRAVVRHGSGIREAFRLRWTKGLCKECGYDFSVSEESEHSFKSK